MTQVGRLGPGPETTRITHQQAIDAVQIILHLAQSATEGGLAAELRLGRNVINEIVSLANDINSN